MYSVRLGLEGPYSVQVQLVLLHNLVNVDRTCWILYAKLKFYLLPTC
jgi:hypothetical protein